MLGRVGRHRNPVEQPEARAFFPVDRPPTGVNGTTSLGLQAGDRPRPAKSSGGRKPVRPPG